MVMGIKNLTWHSVIVPIALPKPDLMPLTGGYRRTPVFQIGADIYCDTQLIATLLEQQYPLPSIFPDHNSGLQMALGSWANGPYVVASVALRMGGEEPLPDNLNLPDHLIEDRKKMWMTQFDTDSLGPKLAFYRSQLDAHTEFINQQLADGRPYLTGENPSWADMHAMWDPWFLMRFSPEEAKRAYGRFPKINEWLERLDALGHGTRIEMEPSEALAVAQSCEPLPATGIAEQDPIGLSSGTTVSVSPSDYAERPRDDDHAVRLCEHIQKRLAQIIGKPQRCQIKDDIAPVQQSHYDALSVHGRNRGNSDIQVPALNTQSHTTILW